MDIALTPPVRLQALSCSPITSKRAHARLDDFVADLQNRCTPSKGADTTVTVQLQKLGAALKEEREMRKRGVDV